MNANKTDALQIAIHSADRFPDESDKAGFYSNQTLYTILSHWIKLNPKLYSVLAPSRLNYSRNLHIFSSRGWRGITYPLERWSCSHESFLECPKLRIEDNLSFESTKSSQIGARRKRALVHPHRLRHPLHLEHFKSRIRLSKARIRFIGHLLSAVPHFGWGSSENSNDKANEGWPHFEANLNDVALGVQSTQVSISRQRFDTRLSPTMLKHVCHSISFRSSWFPTSRSWTLIHTI